MLSWPVPVSRDLLTVEILNTSNWWDKPTPLPSALSGEVDGTGLRGGFTGRSEPPT
jgi:hypothetical protein